MDPQNNQNNGQNKPPQSTQNSNNTVMAAISYIGPLVIIPLLTSKKVPFVKFHIKQGLVVFVIEVIVWILGSMMGSLWMILYIVNLATLVLSIIGIINVTQGNQNELPVVGKFAKSFNF